jgi:D-sedoheptulose 7-phosphate isomerase
MSAWLTSYRTALHQALDSVPIEAIEELVRTVRTAWLSHRTIFIAGNGGNAASASHFATDLGKGASDAAGRRFRVVSLGENMAWLTAIGNDYCYEDVFVRQLENFGQPGDVVLALSVSGDSPNLVRAVAWANEHDLRTVAVVGGRRGRLADIARQTIVVDETHYGRVEDVQMTILHMVCYAFMDHLGDPS